MLITENGDDTSMSIKELESLFQDDESAQETPPADDGTKTPDTPPVSNSEADKEKEKVENTKAFANRLRESTEKARREERDAIAKDLGYDSYDAMKKAREKKLLEDKGLDPEEVSPIVEELVKKRLEDDPRMKELEELRKSRVEEFGRRELAEITKLTGGEITSLDQLPKEVLELWKTKGSLKSAFLELKGEELILKARSEQSKGSTSHLTNPSGSTPPPSGKRHLTEEEKRVWKFFNPNATDEELEKKLIEK